MRLYVFALLILLASVLSVSAVAQTSTYSNTTIGAIDANTACGSNELTRTFIVPATDNFTVGKLEVGFLASHTWRGDIQLDLRSPAGTQVRLINTDTNTLSQDNYNVHMDDGAATLINTAPHNTNDGLAAPPYENLVRPNNPLSAFDGENSVGTWTLLMCDAYIAADNGQFRRADLYFTHASGSDLSLSLAASDPTPNIGSNVFLSYTVSHVGTVAAGGITVSIPLPSGLSYVSDDSGGEYNTNTNIWTIPVSLLNNSRTITITAFVNTNGNFTLTSEIMSSNQPDPDSTPGNGVTTEDDYATLTLAPVTPAVPVLQCPAAPDVMDWDNSAIVWNAGDLTNSYTVNGVPINISVNDPNNALQNDASFGGQTPAESTTNTGGLTPVESSLHFLANQPNQAGTVDIAISIGAAGEGVEKFQLTLFDIDLGANQFVDQITVTGSLNGANVPVTLYSSASNSSSGNVVTGTAASNSNQSLGNMTLEFNSAVDNIIIRYGNGAGAPADPGLQGMAIHDINFCKVKKAVLTAAKTTEVYDPQSQGLYMIPGNDVIYTISFTNTGDGNADADSVVIIDALPDEVTFYNGDIDDSGPQTNPVYGIDNGSGLVLNYAQDVAYSNAASAPANFAACTYTPTAGYDANVKYICINPSGIMQPGNPNPSFEVKFRARIK